MDLRTHYMGLELRSPFIVGASPLSRELDTARELEDRGAGALVVHSLFEEQIEQEELSTHHHLAVHEDSHAEAISYFPEPMEFVRGPDAYLEHLSRLKSSLSIPVIGSLNGTTPHGWTRYAASMQQAGADGIELNVYHVATDPDEDPRAVEQRYIDVLEAVRGEVTIPVAMKLSPFFSAPVFMARKLDEHGAAGLVLYNRFYQPDLDLEELAVTPSLSLSTSEALRLRLRWLAAVFPRVGCSLAASGGVHTARDAIKAIMSGASAVQLVSALLKNGPAHLARMRTEMAEWMVENEYDSVRHMTGCMSLTRCPNPAEYERVNYMAVLQSWRFGVAT